MFIDTHCHIDDEKFTDTDAVVKDYLDAKVETVINMACDIDESERGRLLSEKYPSVYFGAGYHPSDISGYNNDIRDKIKDMSKHKKCVAIGEIGLDYHWEGFDKKEQIKGFVSQIELAKECKLPISIHSRDATFDMVNILRDNKDKLTYGAVMHCFSGSKETAEILLKMGVYISFGGVVTFKNANKLLEVAKFVPDDMYLTETDSPYLSPSPYRGKVNSPKNIPIIAEFIANLRGITTEKFACNVLKNAKALFTKL